MEPYPPGVITNLLARPASPSNSCQSENTPVGASNAHFQRIVQNPTEDSSRSSLTSKENLYDATQSGHSRELPISEQARLVEGEAADTPESSKSQSVKTKEAQEQHPDNGQQHIARIPKRCAPQTSSMRTDTGWEEHSDEYAYDKQQVRIDTFRNLRLKAYLEDGCSDESGDAGSQDLQDFARTTDSFWQQRDLWSDDVNVSGTSTGTFSPRRDIYLPKSRIRIAGQSKVHHNPFGPVNWSPEISVIADLRHMAWADFISRRGLPRRIPTYAIDVLVGEPDVTTPSLAPRRLRDLDPSMEYTQRPSSDLQNHTRPLLLHWNSAIDLPERIRINSKELVKTLSMISGSQLQAPSTSGASVVLLRPFRMLTYYDKETREWCEKLARDLRDATQNGEDNFSEASSHSQSSTRDGNTGTHMS